MKLHDEDQNVSLGKKLVCNIGNQTRRTTVAMPADAKNYYDRIAHAVANVANQHFGVKLECILVLFATTQSIKMFLRTSYGLSKRFYA